MLSAGFSLLPTYRIACHNALKCLSVIAECAPFDLLSVHIFKQMTAMSASEAPIRAGECITLVNVYSMLVCECSIRTSLVFCIVCTTHH